MGFLRLLDSMSHGKEFLGFLAAMVEPSCNSECGGNGMGSSLMQMMVSRLSIYLQSGSVGSNTGADFCGLYVLVLVVASTFRSFVLVVVLTYLDFLLPRKTP